MECGNFPGKFFFVVVPLWEELFGTESSSQVYGVVTECLSQLLGSERERLQT